MTNNQYPSLSQMGITSFDKIIKYTLRQQHGNDVLKIYYKREKGSFLPRSKKFSFGRATRTVMTDSGRQQWQEVREISPFLLRAITELNAIVKAEEPDNSKEAIEQELLHLEQVMSDKLAEIRTKLNVM